MRGPVADTGRERANLRRARLGLLARSSLRAWLVLSGLLASAAAPVQAFFEGNAVGSRAFALGDNFVSVADDASAVYWNPAGVVRVPRHEALLTLERSPDLDGLERLFAGSVVHTRHLSFGAGWSAARLEDTLREDLLYFSLSRQLVRRSLGAFVSAGATLKLAHVSVDDGASATTIGGEAHWSGDLGLLLSPIPNVTVGGSVRNLGQPRFDLLPGGASTQLESEFEWGISLRWRPEASLHFTRAAVEGRAAESRVGVEFQVGQALDVRLGATRRVVAGGIGLCWGRFSLEPSFRAQEELGLVTRIGLQVQFGPVRRAVGEAFDAF